MPRTGLVMILSTVALLMSVTNAHNYVLKPLTEFKSGTSGAGNWVAQFSPPWAGDVSTGTAFATLAKANGVSSTRKFLEDRGPDCGNSNPNAKAKAIPADGKVSLFRSMDHPGPCELWLDNTMVYHNDDCKAAFGSATPSFKVDFASCKGSCMLRFYWLGLQDLGKRMQSYSTWPDGYYIHASYSASGVFAIENCVPLKGSGSSSSNNNLRSRSMDEYTFDDLNKKSD